MSQKVNVQGYLESIRAPWGRLFYELIWHNLECKGKIMQKAVFENNIDEALKLLAREDVESVYFGMINEYEDYQLEEYSRGMLTIDKIYGLRIFMLYREMNLKQVRSGFPGCMSLNVGRRKFPNSGISHFLIILS